MDSNDLMLAGLLALAAALGGRGRVPDPVSLSFRRAPYGQAHPGGDGQQGPAHRPQAAGGDHQQPPPPGRRHAQGTGGQAEAAREGLAAAASAAGGSRRRAPHVLDRERGRRADRRRQHLGDGPEPAGDRADSRRFRRGAGAAALDPCAPDQAAAVQVHRRVRQRHRYHRARRQVGPAADRMPGHHRSRSRRSRSRASSPSWSSSSASACRSPRPSSA